jgi:hypothetical protein
MAAVKVRGDFSAAWAMAHDRAERRRAALARERAEARRDRYPAGQARGAEPWASSFDKLLAATGATVRDWRDDRAGFAYLGSPDRGVSVPPPADAEAFAIAAHEALHHPLFTEQGDPDRATGFSAELETWRAVAAWWRREKLPDAAVLERVAADRLRTRPEARRFGRATLAHALRQQVGSRVRQTPSPSMTLYANSYR